MKTTSIALSVKAGRFLCIALFLTLPIFQLFGKISPIIISEVFYDSPLNEEIGKKDSIVSHHNGEFIELYNPTNVDVDISGWRLYDGGLPFIFKDSTIIKKRDALIVCFRFPGSGFELKDLFPSIKEEDQSRIFYHNRFYLSNNFEKITLYAKDGHSVDEMSYQHRLSTTTKTKQSYWDLQAHNGTEERPEKWLSLQRTNIHWGYAQLFPLADDFQAMLPTPLATADAISLPVVEDYLYGWDTDESSPLGEPMGSANVSSTGGGSYQIPIKVPPGINEFQPQLSIVYNSQSGRGLMGIGWDLSGLSSIGRTTQSLYYDLQEGKIASSKIEFNDTDRLTIDGQRLTLLSGTHFQVGAVYATEVENYSRVEIKQSPETGKIYFEFTTKDGQKAEYGKTANSMVINGRGDDGRVLSWKLNRVVDIHGNDVVYDYMSNGLYISSISYANNTNVIKFSYTLNRNSKNSYLPTEFLIKDDQLLSSIETYSHGQLIRKYNLKYHYSQIDMRLDVVDEEIEKGKKFSSSKVHWGSTDKIEINEVGSNIEISYSQDDDVSCHLGDLNGDGYQDYVIFSQTHGIDCLLYDSSLKRFSSSKKKELIRRTNFKEQIKIVDVDNDGSAEIIMIQRGSIFIYKLINGSLVTH